MMARLEEVTFVKDVLKVVVNIVRSTYDALTQAIEYPEQHPAPTHVNRFAQTLDHLGDVREGFMLSQRVSSRSEVAELRYIAQQTTLDWDWLETMGIALNPNLQVETLAAQLIAYQHTLTVLGLIPRLPAEAVTFPQLQATYADVRVPRRPSQMLERIEEIEHILYRASLTPLNDLAHGAVRRTYAFFEASSWVVHHHLKPLLAE